MNAIPDRRVVGWGVVYGIIAVILVGGVIIGAAIYQQSLANGRVAQRIEDCIDPEGACGAQAVRAREQFGTLLDEQRHVDLASAILCAREYPRGDFTALLLCIRRSETNAP